MSENKKLVPKRRFKEFQNADAWKQHELGRIADVIDPHPSHRAPEAKEVGIPFVGIGDVDVVGNIDYKTVRIIDEQVYEQHHKRYDLNIDSIGIGRVASLGKVIRLRTDIGKYAVSPTMAVLQFKQGSDLNYLYSYMNSEKFQAQFKSLSNGSTRLSVGIQDLRKLELMIPDNIEEQIKIGRFILCLDQTIAFQQRKLEKMKAMKSAYLSEMFPAEGERKPKRRFPGFTDAWEQRELGKYSNILAGGTPNTKVLEYWEPKEVPWMSSGEINKKRLYETDNKISELGLNSSSARWVKQQSILIALAGQGKTRGTVAVNEIPLTTNQSIAAIELDDSFDTNYVFYNLEMRYEELRTISSGDGSRGGLNKQIISDVVVPFPKLDEQEKIGEFFSNLDQTIAFQQQKLEKLQNIKKAYLNEMFI